MSAPHLPVSDTAMREVLAEVARLHDDLLQRRGPPGAVHPLHQLSARNLGHFLTLRSRDRRPLQDALSELGLSSLGRCESHVLHSVAAVHRALSALVGDLPSAPPLPSAGQGPGHLSGRQLLERNTQDLLGAPPPSRWSRIMVTLPTQAATDLGLVERYVAAGMDVARINCAHDGPDIWEQMAHHVRLASERVGRPVRITMDLAGPKLRTTEIPDGPEVRKVRPVRDALGRVVSPATVVLVATSNGSSCGPPPHDPCLPVIPVNPELLDGLAVGPTLELVDARGARRTLDVVEVGPAHARVELRKTAYFASGSPITRLDEVTGLVGTLPRTAGSITVRDGDELWLMAEGVEPPSWPGQSERPRVGCTLPEALDAVQPGHRVFFDDGKIGGTVVAAVPSGALLRITAAGPDGSRLRAEKGINLPDTEIPVAALTDADRRALPHVVRLADAVALSFVRKPRDVVDLEKALSELNAGDLGVVLKIETLAAFGHLPELVATAIRNQRVGIMIARGDLAVEVGYERLAEVQEEILWLCEAAHLPVIWATQVLDTLARTGQPSRAEITDAAMSERADCVMLNKGPHIPLAISTLDDILRRMAGHQSKKRPLLRPLRSWIRD